MLKHQMACVPVDIMLGGKDHDFTQDACVTAIMATIKHYDIKYVHFAIPCNTYSVARYPKLRTKYEPLGIKGGNFSVKE